MAARDIVVGDRIPVYDFNKKESTGEEVTCVERYFPDDVVTYCFEMQDEENPYFMLGNGVITHNCRLKSDIRELGYFNSIGGTALKVGSVKVNTVNLARIALDTKTEDQYLAELEERTYICLCALDAVRHIIKRNVDKGILPNFTYGLIDFEHLYDTIGFLGIYETMKKFKYITVDEFGNTYYTDKASAFGQKNIPDHEESCR
jgi:anaerobic ribonucleoside-triphosphate reductase